MSRFKIENKVFSSIFRRAVKFYRNHQFLKGLIFLTLRNLYSFIFKAKLRQEPDPHFIFPFFSFFGYFFKQTKPSEIIFVTVSNLDNFKTFYFVDCTILHNPIGEKNLFYTLCTFSF